MQVLDTTIANVSLPTIAGNLGVSTDNGTWVITSFAVANGIGVPLTGWLMGRFGVVRTFVRVGAAVHRRLVPVRHRLEPAVAGRLPHAAGRGVGADDPRQPGAADLDLPAATSARTALGIWSMTTLVAPIMGPMLGGYISDNYHWGWIFLINVPVGIVRRLRHAGAASQAARRRPASCRSTWSG